MVFFVCEAREVNNDTYIAAFEQAQSDLNRIREEYEALRKRKESLESLVQVLEPLLPQQPELPLDLPPRPAVLRTAVTEGTLASRRSPSGTRKLAIEAITEAGGALSVPEIHQRIQAKIGSVAARRESIRVLMLRRTDTFRQIGNGLYGLVEGHVKAGQEVERN